MGSLLMTRFAPLWSPVADGGAGGDGAATGKVGEDAAAATAAAAAATAAAAAAAAKGGEGKGGEGNGGGDGGKGGDAAAAAAAAAAKAAGAGGGGDTPADEGEDDPDAWRKELAGDDAKLLAEARRYGGKQDVLKALVEAKGKLRTRNLGPTPLAADATPEQVKAWRTDNGIPEDWKGYAKDIDGFDKIPDEQRKLYETFLEGAHSKNLNPAAVKEAVGIYRKMETDAMDAIVERDLKQESETRETLEADWGGRVGYKQNVAMANNYIAEIFGEAGPALMKGRLADGTIVGNHPGIIKAITNLAREAGYADSYVPPDGTRGGKSTDDRIAEIRKAMGDGSYWKDPKMQAEFTTLLAAQNKAKSRAKN